MNNQGKSILSLVTQCAVTILVLQCRLSFYNRCNEKGQCFCFRSQAQRFSETQRMVGRTNGGRLVQPPHSSLLPTIVSRQLLDLSREEDRTVFLGNVLSHPDSKDVLPPVQVEHSVFQFLPLPLLLLSTTEKSLVPFSRHPLFRYLLMWSPPRHLFSRLNRPSSLSLFL